MSLRRKHMFSDSNLPRIIPGTSGHALPRPGVKVVACLMPETRELNRPPSWGPGAKLTGVAGKHWHIVQDTGGDNYPNDEFDTFYGCTRQLQRGDDPRADFLFDFWPGHAIKVFEAEKKRAAIVLGVCAEGGAFQTPEGPVSFTKGDLLLRSPDADRTWPIRTDTFIKKYDDQGIRQGTPS